VTLSAKGGVRYDGNRSDKASILFDPEWFYLLRARASGELAEYREKASWRVATQEPDRKWLKWLKRDLAKTAVAEAKPKRHSQKRNRF